MYIKIIQHYCIMQKLDGRICDGCRTMFYPEDHINEVCDNCFNSVWIVFSIYSIAGNYIKEMNCVFHSEEKAKEWVEKHKAFLDSLNFGKEHKILDVKYEHWAIL